MTIMDEINAFRDARNWRPFHNEKDLAISVAIEAAELMEIYQWRSPEDVNGPELEHIKEELADVLIYSLMLADNLSLDVNEIIEAKIKQNTEKYPIEKSYGTNLKYTELNESKGE